MSNRHATRQEYKDGQFATYINSIEGQHELLDYEACSYHNCERGSFIEELHPEFEPVVEYDDLSEEQALDFSS